MNIVYTYWSNGLKNIDCGFAIPSFFFMCAEKSLRSALNCKGVDKVVIYTDKFGYELLKTNLHNVNGVKVVIVDYSQYDFDERFWNFPKMITYTLQKEPFIHIDFDVILQPNFLTEIRPHSDILTECVRWNWRTDDKRNELLDYFDNGGSKDYFTICSGLLGTDNIDCLDAFQENFEVAKEYCKSGNFEDVEFVQKWGIEEYNFTKICNKKGYRATPFISETFVHYQGANKYDRFFDEINALKI